MRTVWVIGVVSEILLVVGIIFAAWALGNIITCLNSFCPYLLAPYAEHALSIGLALFFASSIGFLITLVAYHEIPTNKGGTAS